MRVLEAITPSRIGGAEVYVTNFCRELKQLGAEIELFCPSGRPFVDYAAERGLSAITWKTHGKLDPVTVIRLARLMKSRNIDVIHTHLSTASLLGAFAATLAGKRSVAHVHGLNSATCFRRSSAVIAVSEAVKRHLVGQGLPERKIHVVHNGVDISRFEPQNKTEAKCKFGYDADKQLFGVFGRLSSEKGQRVAIEAMFLVARECPNAELILAGEGKDADELHEAAKALGIADNVCFAGFVPDVRGLMSACDAIVVPSLREGFGLAAVEAMALGRPVVASLTGGLDEIVVRGETGFLVPPNDSQAVAESLFELIDNPALAQSMGERGRAVAREHFDSRKQYWEAFRIICGECG